MFPVGTKIGERTEAFHQFLIPRLKLVQHVTLLKEVNAIRRMGLPGFDLLVKISATREARQVGMKNEKEIRKS